MPKKVLIIGAGGVGQVVAHKCAQGPETVAEVCLASRTLSRCNKIAEQIKRIEKRDIQTAQVDADNVFRFAVVCDFLAELEQPVRRNFYFFHHGFLRRLLNIQMVCGNIIRHILFDKLRYAFDSVFFYFFPDLRG